jgi:hypothetical protein
MELSKSAMREIRLRTAFRQARFMHRIGQSRVAELAHAAARSTAAQHREEISKRNLEVGATVRLSPEGAIDTIENFTAWHWVQLKNKKIPVPPKDVTRIENSQSPLP